MKLNAWLVAKIICVLAVFFLISFGLGRHAATYLKEHPEIKELWNDYIDIPFPVTLAVWFGFTCVIIYFMADDEGSQRRKVKTEGGADAEKQNGGDV